MAERDLSGRTLGEYILREQIGAGGHAAVYRAEQPALRRDVVVKVLHERRQRNDASRERFLREAQLASRLDHPYAAHVYDSGAEDEDGLLWIAMERVHGVTLGEWLETRGPMPLDQLVPLFECVAQVVQAAHDDGIIHRDLKPSNIMVIERGGRLFPKLLDFGIAKLDPELASAMPASPPDGPLAEGHEPEDAPDEPHHGHRTLTNPEVVDSSAEAEEDRITPTGVQIGSMAYMAPEQWRNAKAVGPAADIYSLGIVVYQALTGRMPYTGAITGEFYRQHCFSTVPSLGRRFSPDLDRVVQRALAKDPQARHGDVLELASELRAVLRATAREQLRASAQQWADRGRAPGLLWGADLLRDIAGQIPPAGLSKLECSFLANSQRRARRSRWTRRLLVALAPAVVLAGIGCWAVLQARAAREQARMAQQFADRSITQAEVEAGRQALLHDESAEAQRHLAEAYRRGDHSPATAFMLARALQPRLAEQARFSSSSGRMWSAAFSPDRRQIVTTDDKAAQVWDARTHERTFTLQHGDAVYDARYSGDSARLVTACGDGAVRIWDTTTGALMHTLKRQRADGKPSRYFVATFSPDDRLVAAIDTAGAVTHVWDAASGAPLAELRNDAANFPSIAFSADSRWLATSGGEKARVFDTRTWAQVLTLAGPHIRALSFDPTAPRLATGNAGGDATIWEVPSGARAQHLREIGAPVRAVAFSPDGDLVATGGGDGVAQFWDAKSGALRNQINAIRGRILSIEFDPASNLAVAAGDGGAVVIAETLGMPVVVLDAPRAIVRTAHFDPTSRHVISASWDGTVKVWDATSPYRRWSSPPLAADCGLITSLEPDRRFIAVGCRDLSTRVWDTARDQLLAELPGVTSVTGDFASAFPAVSATGDRAAIARGDTVEVYELPSSRLVRVLRHHAAIDAVAFAPAGHDLVSGATDGSLLVTRDGGEPIALPMSPGGVDAVGVLVDGRVVAADARGRLRIYDPERVAVIADLELPTRVRLLRPSPDGSRLVTIPSFTGKATAPLLWDFERYRQIAELDDHVGRVFSARFVDDGREILTAGNDGVARLWNSETGRLLSSYRSTSRFLADAVVASNGSMVIAGGSDGLLWFWDRATTRPLWKLQAHGSHTVGIHLEGDEVVTRGFAGEVARWTLPAPGQVIEAALPDR